MDKLDAHVWVLDTVLDMIIYAGVNGLHRSSEALIAIYPELEQEVEAMKPKNVVRFPTRQLR
ncbi:hypothetical protein RTM1035_09733 [Roseovarius sp. TM1035]|uniref:Uncharacterized protein n=1 Tax=Roseovarius mucosus TaxID=215743 RepID=A0A1V0RJJ9_9RHOB|nr:MULTISPECIES: hypothetical protein [Roseovarius]ARE81969.1 hypothetical protein ROSMUCSMR3_00465 [Roseovarius mucosus]EDM29966.1 hypothetical protein RTM1035_09733 [Roseovarius sp. TM1035]MBW4972288.1 hypothetical protein [Roseovarius mucosus]|tara:strand:+ start:6947 stop:7132 length:186 start_codon:yes stop_codon:yes gene_type:complete